MYYVYKAGLCADGVIYPSIGQTGWLTTACTPAQDGFKLFDFAQSFSSFDEADKAAKAAGWKRYVILQVPVVTVCECENLLRLHGDPDEYSEEF